MPDTTDTTPVEWVPTIEEVPASEVQTLELIQCLETTAAIYAELRHFQKLYGRASATIGVERGTVARLRDRLGDARHALDIEIGSDRFDDADAPVRLSRLHARCTELLAGPYRHIAIGEVLQIIGRPQ